MEIGNLRDGADIIPPVGVNTVCLIDGAQHGSIHLVHLAQTCLRFDAKMWAIDWTLRKEWQFPKPEGDGAIEIPYSPLMQKEFADRLVGLISIAGSIVLLKDVESLEIDEQGEVFKGISKNVCQHITCNFVRSRDLQLTDKYTM